MLQTLTIDKGILDTLLAMITNFYFHDYVTDNIHACNMKWSPNSVLCDLLFDAYVHPMHT
jgi:hypothetical protein